MGISSFRVNWRDEANLPVENAQQVVKVLRSVSVSRYLEQLPLRLHGPFDVSSCIGRKDRQNSPGRSLMIAVFGWSGGGTEGLFQEHGTDSFCAADFTQ